MNLFVYGSLRPGGSRYGSIAERVVAEVEADLEGRLFAMPDGNPIVVEGGQDSTVKGALLVLPDSPIVLRELDQIEGVSDPRSLYQRVQRQVQSTRGDDQAFVYLCKSDRIYQVLADGTEILEGDWFLFEGA